MDQLEIQRLLHHRPPYLMVDKVSEISDKHIIAFKNHRGDEAHLQGHFPGSPVVPGAMLQELCTQAAGILITKYHCPIENYNSEVHKGHALGVLNKVLHAKFLEIVKPEREITAKVELLDNIDSLFKFYACIYQDDRLKAKTSFHLMNISDKYITN